MHSSTMDCGKIHFILMVNFKNFKNEIFKQVNTINNKKIKTVIIVKYKTRKI